MQSDRQADGVWRYCLAAKEQWPSQDANRNLSSALSGTFSRASSAEFLQHSVQGWQSFETKKIDKDGATNTDMWHIWTHAAAQPEKQQTTKSLIDCFFVQIATVMWL